MKEQKEEELEKLRREVYTATTTKKVLNDEYEELRKKVHVKRWWSLREWKTISIN